MLLMAQGEVMEARNERPAITIHNIIATDWEVGNKWPVPVGAYPQAKIEEWEAETKRRFQWELDRKLQGAA